MSHTADRTSTVEIYFERKLADFQIVPPLSADWEDLKNTVKDLLNLQSNSYLELMYPCKALLSYHIWYRDPALKEDQYSTSSVDINQSIIIVGKPDTPFHINLLHEYLDLKTLPQYYIVAFLYPECGKVVMFVPEQHIMSESDLSSFSHRLFTFNWNWFYRDFTKVHNKTQMLHIDLTLSTGVSAMPLGICNVIMPRFDYSIRRVSQDLKTSRISYHYQYPMDQNV